MKVTEQMPHRRMLTVWPLLLGLIFNGGAQGEVVNMSTAKTEFVQTLGTPIAVIDLQGQPLTLDLRALPASDATALRLKGTETQPALLLRAKHSLDSGEQRDTLIFCSLEEPPRIFWEEVTRAIRADGGGFDSYTLDLVRPARGGKWLEIQLLQSTVPGAAETPYMPGPPLVLRYVFKGKRYQRVK